MKVITDTIKIELTEEEKSLLTNARDLVDTITDAVLEAHGWLYTRDAHWREENFTDTIDFLTELAESELLVRI